MARTIQIGVVLKAFDKISPVLNKASGSFSKFGKKLQGIGAKASLAISAPLTAFAGLSLRTAVDFQRSMNMVGAVTNATAVQFDMLKDTARNMGAITQFSAAQAADGLKFLGMAGKDVQTSISMLPKVLELAASAQLDMGSSADIVTNVMDAFGMKTQDLGRANDVLVNAFTKSNQNLLELSEAMKKAGPVARSMGFDFVEVTGALSLLASAGIKGSEAGTGLRRIMANIGNVTPKATKELKLLGIQTHNADGSLKTLTGMLQEFEKAQDRWTKKMGKARAEAAINTVIMDAFGMRAGPHFMALLGKGSGALIEMEKKLGETGTAARVAEGQMKGLPGAILQMKSAWQELQLSLVDITGGTIKKGINYITELFRKFSKLDESTKKWVIALGTLAAILPPIIIAIGGLAAAIGAALSPIGLIIIGTIAVTAAFARLYSKWDEMPKWAKILMTIFMPFIALPVIIAKSLANSWDKISDWWLKIKSLFATAISGILKMMAKIFDLPGLSFVAKKIGIDTTDLREGATYMAEQSQKYKKQLAFRLEDRKIAENFRRNATGPFRMRSPEEIDRARSGIGAYLAGGPMGTDGTKHKADVTIRVLGDTGLNPVIEQVRQAGEGTNLTVATETERGAQ